MIGAILGDVVGSRFEHHPIKTTEFDLLTVACEATDDSVLTVATAEALMGDRDFASAYREWGRRYPWAGYGGWFLDWLDDEEAGPYRSFGNGSAMRVAPVGWFASSLEEALELARETAVVTHDHPEGVKGAKAVAAAVWLARQGVEPSKLRDELEARFAYELRRSISNIRLTYAFDVTCQGSVPEALICALEARSVEEAVRLAVSLGGDADTQACIAGAVAEARFGGVPAELEAAVRPYLDEEMAAVVESFRARHVVGP